MPKVIFKEILLTLLIIVAIVLILAVVFYQFIPSNRVIPSKVTAYQATEEVLKEIEEDVTSELPEQQRTYEITDEDLSLYKKIDSYRPGKVDPFAEVSENTIGEESGGNTLKDNTVSGGNDKVQDKNTTNNFYTASGIGSSTK